jgi:glycosyl transferase family 25
VESPFDLLNRTFDRIFVVTLPRACERQRHARARLAGLDYRFHFGADAARLDLATLEQDGTYDPCRARRVSRLGRPMSAGQLGCALSHRQIYEETVRHGWSRVLVLEDDVGPTVEIASAAAALAELPEDWELLYAGWSNFEVVTPGMRLKRAAYVGLSALQLMKWTPEQVLRMHPAAHSLHLRRAGLHHGTFAYAFTLGAAQKLLAAQTPVAWVADQLLIHLVLSGAVKAFITEPKLFSEESAAIARLEPLSYVRAARS